MNNEEQCKSPKNLVSSILNDEISLENISIDVMDRLKGIGASEHEIDGRSFWFIKYGNDHDLARKLHDLNRLDFLFVGQPYGWPPAAIFDQIREKASYERNLRKSAGAGREIGSL